MKLLDKGKVLMIASNYDSTATCGRGKEAPREHSQSCVRRRWWRRRLNRRYHHLYSNQSGPSIQSATRSHAHASLPGVSIHLGNRSRNNR